MNEHDAAEVAAAFRASLPPGHLDVFRIDPLDRLGIPVVQATLLPADGGPGYTGFGYGVTEAEAERGAVAELCEEVWIGRHVAVLPRTVASFDALLSERGTDGVVDPLTLCLPAGSAYQPDMPLVWVPARRLSDGGTALVPIEWIAAYPHQIDAAPPRLITPITNGLGAGLSLEQALAHGVLELLQRDGNAVSFRALDQGTVVDLDRIADSETRSLIDHVRAAGIGLTVKLAAADFGMADLYVVGDDSREIGEAICVTACGEAVHPDRERALRKAVLEFIGSRPRKVATHGPIEAIARVAPRAYMKRNLESIDLHLEEPRALQAMIDWLPRSAGELRILLADGIFAERRRVPFSGLPTAPPDEVSDHRDRLGVVAERLRAEGFEIYYVDASPPTGDGLKVVKVVVPGLESETMSYGRIGERGVRRLEERGDPLVLREPREGARPVRLTREAEARLGGPVWYDARRADEIVGELYPLYREPGGFAAQMALRERAGAMS